MVDSLSGGTTNLLRMARSGCQSAVAFVALAIDEQSFATATYPSALEPDALNGAEVDEIVRQLWTDPGLSQGKSLLRTVYLGASLTAGSRVRLAVAAVPLGLTARGGVSGVLGIADPAVSAFGMPELQLLARIAQRLTSYVQARQAIRSELRTRSRTASEPQPARPEAPGRDALPPQAPPLSPPWSFGSSADARTSVEPSHPEHQEQPPFPPPAGTTGVARPAAAGPAGARPEPFVPDLMAGGATQSSGTPVGEPLRVSLRSDHEQEGELPGLVPLGSLLSRAGRLLGAGTARSGALAVVALEAKGLTDDVAGTAAQVAQAIRRGLRFDDPVARIGPLSFVAVVPLAPGASSAAQVEDHLVGLARAAVGGETGAKVRAAHVVAPLNGEHEADELLRAAVVKLRAL